MPSHTYDIAFGNQTYTLKIDEILSAWQSYPDNSIHSPGSRITDNGT